MRVHEALTRVRGAVRPRFLVCPRRHYEACLRLLQRSRLPTRLCVHIADSTSGIVLSLTFTRSWLPTRGGSCPARGGCHAALLDLCCTCLFSRLHFIVLILVYRARFFEPYCAGDQTKRIFGFEAATISDPCPYDVQPRVCGHDIFEKFRRLAVWYIATDNVPSSTLTLKVPGGRDRPFLPCAVGDRNSRNKMNENSVLSWRPQIYGDELS